MSIKMPEGVTLWPIAQLSTYFRNPRTHTSEQVKTLARMMKAYGWTDPIVVDEKQGILAGHLRYATALHLGLQEVPVVEVTHLTEPEKRAFVVAHNQVATKSGWNNRLLAEELQAIQAADLDLSMAAFTDEELAVLEQSVERGMTDLPGFTPSLNPESDRSRVTQDDMDSARESQGEQFARNEFLSRVVCPGCGQPFYLNAPPANPHPTHE